MTAKRTPGARAFSKILIANRGEIAVRILRTAHAEGYRSVAVYSDADAGAPHVRLADEAVRIGPAPVGESYLAIPALIAAALASGADAVHPGYGFLSENADFAAACVAAGLVFIGPPAEAIRAMGNKAQAKRLMIAAGVPCVPGYQGADQSEATFQMEAARIGYPVMVKAAAGGGGRGMRLVTAPEAFGAALAGARSEAANAFGSDELILEKAVVGARHIEIQVFADTRGAVIHLGERDCSIQRRHQKVIEEAPSPAVSPALRREMGAAAAAAAGAIGYVGAGTVEFLLAATGEFYFLEMNTRLQVEHPVTEMITGQDLVAWQLKVASGEALPLTQDAVVIRGHAIEARLYAEDPYQDFLPQSGTIALFAPAGGPGVRLDHGLASGQEISPYYDPMIAKVIAWGENRDAARRRLARALEETVVLGLATNRRFLIDIMRDETFAAGAATTAFIPECFPPGSPRLQKPEPGRASWLLAAALLFEASERGADGSAAFWHSTGSARWPLKLKQGENTREMNLALLAPGHYQITDADGADEIALIEKGHEYVRFQAQGKQASARFAFADGALHLEDRGASFRFDEILLHPSDAAETEGDGRLLAPMNGRIVAVLAQAGESVAKGQRLIVLEAMKMQHELAAGRAGTIARLAVKEGDQVATRQLLVALAPEA